MLFSRSTYAERRSRLRQLVGSGIIFIPGNNDSPCNFPNNPYKFRQDSSFLYFTGQHRDGLALVIDCESGVETLVGNDIDIDDIIWTGPVPSMADMATESGIERTAPKSELATIFAEARRLGRRVHYLPPYRHDIMIEMADLTGLHPLKVREAASIELIRAVVALRNIKSEEEIAELDRAAAIGYEMHTTAMRMAVQPGMTEAAIAGALDGIASSRGSMVPSPPSYRCTAKCCTVSPRRPRSIPRACSWSTPVPNRASTTAPTTRAPRPFRAASASASAMSTTLWWTATTWRSKWRAPG